MSDLKPDLIDISTVYDLRHYIKRQHKTNPKIIKGGKNLRSIFSVFDDPKITLRLFIFVFFLLIFLFLYTRYKNKEAKIAQGLLIAN
jgi:hypothetical protein